MIDRLVADGTISLIAIAVIVAEVSILLLIGRKGASLGKTGLVANGLAGVCLLLALRAALTGSTPSHIALWLGLSFVAHLGDVISRLRG